MIKTLCLFLFLAGVRSVWLVEPPNNVTIHCQNGTHIAYWNYSGSSTTVVFNVVIDSYLYSTSTPLNTSQRHIDISSFTPPREMEEYNVSVAALEGVDKSKPVSVGFTYSEDFSANHTCFMALPTPNVRVETSRIQFSFARPHSNRIIYYTVSTSHDEQSVDLECPLEAVMCHGAIQLNLSSIKDCTTLKIEGRIDGIVYKTSKQMCNFAPDKGPWPIVLCVVICVIVLATLVGIIFSARKFFKSLIRQSSSYVPVSLNPRVLGSPNLLQPESTIACHAQTGSTPLLQTPENSPTDSQTVIPTESSPEKTHFLSSAPAPCSGDQLGDGYEARIKNDPEPYPQTQMEGDEGRDDGYRDDSYRDDSYRDDDYMENGNELRDGYEARIKNDLEPDPQTQMEGDEGRGDSYRDDGYRDDDYMENGDQLGDGYEAHIENELEPEPQSQMEADDGYMTRERIRDTPDSADSSSIDDIAIEIEIAPEDHVTGYGPR